jgi:predicted DNA-binding protein
MAADMSEQVMVRLTPDLLDQLKTVAEDQERTVAQTVRLAIKQFLGEAAAQTA